MKRISVAEYKSIVTDVLVIVDRICRTNNLKYMIMYGTLIGAVRHKGFIPWDDDIDIVMPRQDYNRLCQLINSGDYGISFISPDTNTDTIYPYGKVCDNHTVVKEKNFIRIDGYGAFVDVFPLDYLPNDKKKRIKYSRKCRNLMRWITHSSRTGYEKSSKISVCIARLFAYNIGKLLDTKKMVQHLNSLMVDYSALGETDFIGIPWGYNSDKLYPTKLFEDVIELEFEGHLFYAPKEYDQILRLRYGDYMELPPEEERVYLHSLECYLKE